jgi:cbb3-type cytochrome oxidase subunit 3|tara:strand:+ start:2892 stop:3563 length:672 start_codon:yes stop_codon:yes gene_type:complete
MDSTLSLYNEIVIFIFFVATVIWIGLTFYSSLISQEYLLKASLSEKKSYMLDIQANVMWYMRWSSLISFSLSVYLMSFLSSIEFAYNIGTSLASLLITIMFLNTWAIIWRKQKRIIAQTSDWVKCESRYDLAIRTNTLFSVPLLALMLYSAQAKNVLNPLLELDGSIGPGWSSISLWISLSLILVVELNLIFGKNRNWMDSAKKLLISGLVLTTIIGYLLRFA